MKILDDRWRKYLKFQTNCIAFWWRNNDEKYGKQEKYSGNRCKKQKNC